MPASPTLTKSGAPCRFWPRPVRVISLALNLLPVDQQANEQAPKDLLNPANKSAP
jgi:hypothetical protein